MDEELDHLNGGRTKLSDQQVIVAMLMQTRDQLARKNTLLQQRQARIAELEARVAELEPVVFSVENARIIQENAALAGDAGLPEAFKLMQVEGDWYFER